MFDRSLVRVNVYIMLYIQCVCNAKSFEDKNRKIIIIMVSLKKLETKERWRSEAPS